MTRKSWRNASITGAKNYVSPPAWDFAYRQFFTSLEVTVEELTKCFLLEFGEDRELSFGRCAKEKSFHELYDGLNNLE